MKLLNTFTTKRRAPVRPQVGETTEDFIKEARQELKKQKKEMKSKRS